MRILVMILALFVANFAYAAEKSKECEEKTDALGTLIVLSIAQNPDVDARSLMSYVIGKNDLEKECGMGYNELEEYILKKSDKFLQSKGF